MATDDILNQELATLEVSTRVSNVFKDENILTVRDLLFYTEESLLRLPNFGSKSLKELKEALKPLGVMLGVSSNGSPFELIIKIVGPLNLCVRELTTSGLYGPSALDTARSLIKEGLIRAITVGLLKVTRGQQQEISFRSMDHVWHLKTLYSALEEIGGLTDVQCDEGPAIARRALDEIMRKHGT